MACNLGHNHWHILGEAHKDHRAVRMQVVAEANLVAPVYLNRRDVDPKRKTLDFMEFPLQKQPFGSTSSQSLSLRAFTAVQEGARALTQLKETNENSMF